MSHSSSSTRTSKVGFALLSNFEPLPYYFLHFHTTGSDLDLLERKSDYFVTFYDFALLLHSNPLKLILFVFVSLWTPTFHQNLET